MTRSNNYFSFITYFIEVRIVFVKFVFNNYNTNILITTPRDFIINIFINVTKTYSRV